MENLIIIVLLVILVSLVAAGLYFLYFHKDGSAAAPVQRQAAPAGTLVNMRSAVAGGPGKGRVRVYEMDSETFMSMQPIPFDFVMSDEIDDEPTLLDLFRDPSTPHEEKLEIADRLRALGYIVNYPVSGPAAAPAEMADDGVADSEEDGDGDSSVPVSEQTDVYVLQDILTNPFSSEEDRETAKKRLAELRGADPEPDSSGDLEDKDDEKDDKDGGEDDGFYGGGYVDPLDMVSIDDPHPEVPYMGESGNADSVDDMDVLEETAGPAGAAEDDAAEEADSSATASGMVSGPADEEVEIGIAEGFEADDADSRKAISLMSFIARSLKAGLISPELAAFAQEKLHLEVADNYWTPEQRLRARQREGVFRRDETLVNMSLDEFDLHVREVVSNNETASYPAEASAPRQEVSGGDAAVGPETHGDAASDGPVPAVPAPVPVKPKAGTSVPSRRRTGARPVSAFFDAHGGKNDLMWARLDPSFE